ncbi:GspH/FimT family pseudopilin [Tahibacter amnicola]|uniref:Type II secretion system protein H n=1 Tax=Tahibacter amnicola TaxID=2976241 RepID=A0ABY6BBE6_9GAMM|nr:GspH/FimT family protein [Tahibacter amnicola]UXI67184.1 GspH/FimT family protein [Tahibacter amnicola]
MLLETHMVTFLSHSNIGGLMALSGYRGRPAVVRTSGFSLIELMIIVAIIAIAVAIGLPSMREMMVSNAATDATNRLVGDLGLARQEAVKRGLRVGVFADSGNNIWTGGWKVKADVKRNGTYELVLRETPALHDGYALKVAVDGAEGDAVGSKATIFNGTGALTMGDTADFNLCAPNSDATRSRSIRVSTTGLVTSQRTTTGSNAPSC